MTLEAQAHSLLAQIGETQEWAREMCSCVRIEATVECLRCYSKRWVALTDLEVAAWRAATWLLGRGCMFYTVFGEIRIVHDTATVNKERCDDPCIAVFSAVLELLKEEANA